MLLEPRQKKSIKVGFIPVDETLKTSILVVRYVDVYFLVLIVIVFYLNFLFFLLLLQMSKKINKYGIFNF